MNYLSFQLRLLSVLFLILPVQEKSVASEATQPEGTKWTISYLIQSTGTYVFPGSDTTKVSNAGLAFGKRFGDAGATYAIQPVGLEIQTLTPWTHQGRVNLLVDLRVVPTRFRLTANDADQKGLDSMLTLGTQIQGQLDADLKVGMTPSVRMRFWTLENGALPKRTGHFGLVLAAFIENSSWQGLFEAGLMAMGLSVPETLGNQRDASSLRARITYIRGFNLFSETTPIRPWVEFFHTHRTFLGSTLVAGENALFIDQASVILGLSVQF